MDTRQERLSRLDNVLLNKRQICGSEGVLSPFPAALKESSTIDGVGLVIHRQRSFAFILSQKSFSVRAGDTLSLPKDFLFQVLYSSVDVKIFIFIYQTDPIWDIIGNSVVSMNLYSHLVTEPCHAWNTGEEEEILRYLSLLGSTLNIEENTLNRYEQKLFLLTLAYGLRSIYTCKLIAEKASVSHKHDIFIRLVQLVEQYYTKRRGVDFHAGKLYLSPKYLSALPRSICGYTVQGLVFKFIIRKSTSLLKDTQRNAQEISDFFNFPSASCFGTFFKKQTGMSP